MLPFQRQRQWGSMLLPLILHLFLVYVLQHFHRMRGFSASWIQSLVFSFSKRVLNTSKHSLQFSFDSFCWICFKFSKLSCRKDFTTFFNVTLTIKYYYTATFILLQNNDVLVIRKILYYLFIFIWRFYASIQVLLILLLS